MDIIVFGSINLVTFVLFLIGIICLVIEIFTPGIGVPAGIAFVAFIIGIIFQAKTILEAVIMIAVLCGIFALIIFLFIRSAKKGKLSKTVILNNTVEDDRADRSFLVGKTGVAHTVLRPSGAVTIDGVKYDAMTEGEFIACGAKITVTKAGDLTLTVEKANEDMPDM